MHRVPFKTVYKHFLVEVYKALMATALALELDDGTLNICPCKRMRVSEQNVISCSEVFFQSELPGEVNAFAGTTKGDVRWYALPALRKDWHLSSLHSKKLLVRRDEVDWLVAVAEQPRLVTLIDHSEAQSSWGFHTALNWQTSYTEVELCSLLDPLNVGH